MFQFEDLIFEPIFEEDVKPLTEIMTRVFDYDTKIHLDNVDFGHVLPFITFPKGY